MCQEQEAVVAHCRWAASKKKPCEKIEQLEGISSLPVLTVAQVGCGGMLPVCRWRYCIEEMHMQS